MNRKRHRVVFNAARGLRVAVAECTRGMGNAGSTLTAAAAVAITSLLFPAHAQIVADPGAPGGQRPTVLAAPNGVPLVNIQTPSPAGVSRNTYSQFDVNAQGAILNNSRTNAPTQLGGWVQSNPWLAGGSARVILNEVNSANPSHLRGFVEVAGQRAEVIIANPAGIQVNGGGFINASAVMLTTGTPVMNAGTLEAFRVQRGQVQIEGLGLDTRSADHTAILARAVQVNAGLWAQQLTLVTGANEVALDTGAAPQSTPIAPAGPVPAFALDVAAIGGMYAGKIFLMGSEAGLGVNNAGVLSATGGLTLLVSGQLVNRGALYADAIDIRTPGVQNEGGAVMAARESLHLQTDTLLNREGGQLLSLGDLSIEAGTRVENRSASIEAMGSMSITTPVLINANDHFETELVAQPGQRYLRLRHGGVDHEQHELGMNFDRLDHYADEASWAVLLPSAEYPFAQYPALVGNWGVAADGRFQLQRSRTSVQVCSECNPEEHDTYAPDHGIWQRFNVASPGPAPAYSGPNCLDENAACSPTQWSEHAAWQIQFNQYNAHKYQQQNALDQRIDAYNASVASRTLIDWVVIDATRTAHTPRVVHSAPGQIVAAGDLQLNVGAQLINHNSEILAGGALSVQGAALENRGSDLIARTEDVGQAVLSQYHDDGLFNNDDRLYHFSPYQAVQEHGERLSVARSGAGQAIPALSANALFQPSPNPQSAYLIETDPRFADLRQWLGSDYLLSALAVDPTSLHKRLGDGFYEQRLIREQVGHLTGRRFLGDFRDDEVQYRALMNAGLTFAQAHALRPGIALTAAQVAALTSDIVWLVTEDVTLPDGRTQHALVPRVYLSPRPGDLAPGGALMAGNAVHIDVSGNVLNSGTVGGRQLVRIDAGRDIGHSGTITTDGVALLNAGRDVALQGGEISATDAIGLNAGRDLQLASTNRTTATQAGDNRFERTGIDRQARLYVSGEAGVILAQAGRDITLTAARITHDGEEGGSTGFIAGRDLDLGTVRTAALDDLHWNADNRQRTAHTQEIGTRIDTAGDVRLLAGRDVSARAANVQSSGDLVVQARRDVQVRAGEQTLDFADAHHKTSSGFLSSGSVTTRSTVNTSDAIASQFGGRTVDVQSGQDLTVQGSNVISDQGTALQAERDVHISAAQTTFSSTDFREEKRSGLMDSDGGFMLGSQQQSTDRQRSGTGASASTVGAISGNVSIIAGRSYHQIGSDVLSPQGDIDILAQDIRITEARTREMSRLEEKTRQSGISIGAGGAFVEAAQSVGSTIEATGKTDDRRMQALGAAAAGMQAYSAGASIAKDPQSAVGVTISIGASSSQHVLEREADSARGSNLSARGDVRLIAGGAGDQSDILVRGSHIKAGDAAVLSAEGDIELHAATNNARERSRSESRNASVSATYNGSWSFSATAQSGQGAGDGQELHHTHTRIDAGHLVQLESGGNTRLQGAVVAANTVKAEVGGDLTIESLQDTSTWRESSSQSGGSVGYGNGGVTGASASAGRTRIDSDFASVGEQSGIRAGDGGFQVDVQGNTNLIGGAITSTDKAVQDGLNRFDGQGGLELGDIHNRASFEASGASVSVGVGSQLGSSDAGIGSDKGSAESTTYAAISGIAGNTGARTGDTETGIAAIFDKERTREEVEAQITITKAFGQQVSRTVASYAASQTQALKEQLQAENDLAKQMTLQDEISKWEEGGIYRVALHTVAGALSGGVAGATGAAAISASANVMQMLQDNIEQGLLAAGMSSSAARVVGQSVAAITAVGVGTTVGGTKGAVSAFSVDTNNRQLHPNEEKWLQEKAKDFARTENISEQEALARLTQQALKEVDYLWRAQLADGDDAAAKAFLSSNQQTFTNDLGENQKLFTATGQQLFRPEMFADSANPNFYKQFAQSGIVRDLTTGLMKELRDSGIDIKNGAVDLLQAAKERPVAVLEGVWNAVMKLPQSVVGSFKEAGTAIGEGAAVVLSPELTAKLNDIYGTDTANAQKALLAIRIATTITGVAGAGKVGAQAGEAAVEAVGKKLDDVAKAKAEAQAIAKKRIENNNYADGASSTPVGLQTSGGVIPANPEKTTTVLGRYVLDMQSVIEEQLGAHKSVDFGPRPGGFNVLNVPQEIADRAGPQFFEAVNKPFLEEAIRRGDDIALATIPLRRSEIISPITGKLNGMYAFELKFLVENGVTPSNIPVQKWSEIQGWFR